ncbi:unnamed protein product [Symbiodinium pilosum]|uniref:Uncharacterized protein n=1 Tax=Symbiodinium pilosum TaxID=2952 RepID=A0A812R3S2_SYMPI|nr:unnamed protein product [Symbiodinium pilosum]
MYLRRLTEQDAIQALEMWSRSPAANDVPAVELQSVQSRLRAAMRSTVPLWHVIVDSLGDAVDGYGKPPGFAVSTYFMQNMDELRELARQCLVEFLEEDKPDELEEAIQNPQFQEWARQWYLQSEDLSDVRSVRYMCRLPGCNVLLHCIRNDFGECCKLLLSRFSDQTRAQDWLVLAEPMRVFNQYEGISFHEAAYCGSTECLQALIEYANQHGISWKEVKDKQGKTALEVAKSQVGGRVGERVPALQILQLEHGVTDLVQPACDASQEGILIASLAHSTEGGKWEETARKRCPLAAATTTWSELLSLTQRALQELHEIRSTDDEKVLLLLSKTAVQDDDGSAIHSFFEVCCNVASLGFNKCTLTSPEAATIVLSAVRSCLQKETPPRWERLYIFQAMALPTTGHETDAHAAVEHKQKFAHMIEHLCQLIVKQPSCPLWRVDSLPVSRLTEENRHLAALLKSALDVKGCIRLLRAGNFPYRFFWTRLTWMERRLKRAEMGIVAQTNFLSRSEAT